jgi:HJR/Mrr/RecB family endonuclease
MSIDQKALENINAHLAQLETRSDGAQAAEKHYFEILRALLEYEGFDVRTDQHGLEHLDLNATSRCEPYIRIGAEFKHYQSQRPIDEITVRRVLQSARRTDCDRIIFVANRPFSTEAYRLAAQEEPVDFKLIDLPELRKWVARVSAELDDVVRGFIDITREYLKRAAMIIAQRPEELNSVPWRTLEELLGETLAELGFDVTVTPATGDGGKDAVVRAIVRGHGVTYYVELKHWKTSRVGASTVRRFLELTARDDVDGGLYLATAGYTQPTFELLAEINRPVVLGDGGKIVSLCRTYARSRAGLWSPPSNPFEVLQADAQALKTRVI